MSSRRRVALLIESSRSYGRTVLQAITAYSRVHGPWSLYYEQRQTAEKPPSWLRTWRGDGIISRVDDLALACAIARTGLPAVDLRGRVCSTMPVVKNDDRRIAEMVADHLLDRGFVHLAFCGYTGLAYSERRCEHFCACLARHGLPCPVYQSVPPRPRAGQREVEAAGLRRDPKLIRWLRSLPKPVGIMASNDVRGQQVLNTCRELDIAVPEQVALVGVDNDDVLCDLADPPMSSVDLDTRRIGFEAAALLERMMAGAAPPNQRILVPPLGVIARQSSDVLAIADPDVAAAVRHIRLYAVDGLDVNDVAAKSSVSRRTLERRFARLLGRTPKAEILRVRLDRVKQLLIETDWPLSRVADRAGFLFPEYMNVAFKRELGVTPGEFRRQHASHEAVSLRDRA